MYLLTAKIIDFFSAEVKCVSAGLAHGWVTPGQLAADVYKGHCIKDLINNHTHGSTCQGANLLTYHGAMESK